MLQHNKQTPIGLIPAWLYYEQRKDDILSAIDRYVKADKMPPDIWIEELFKINELQKKSKECFDKNQFHPVKNADI